jgi:hypothetical protein
MKANPIAEKARKVVAGRNKDATASIDTSAFPKPVGKNGSRVRIRTGDLIDEDATTTIASLGGEDARIDGRPYVAVGGPNKGQVIQPCRIEGTSTLVGVPTKNLRAESGTTSARVGWTPRYENEYDRIFGRNRRS